MRFSLQLSIINLLVPCLQFGLIYWFLIPIWIEGNIHLICAFTQSMVALWDFVLSAQASRMDWKMYWYWSQVQSIARLSSSIKSFSVTFPLSHFPVVSYIQSLPVKRLTSYGNATAPRLCLPLISCSFPVDC